MFKMYAFLVKFQHLIHIKRNKSIMFTMYPITGYDQKYDISNKGDVRELRGNRYYLISFVQNASTEYVYLSKSGKNMRKNIGPLMKRFVYKGTK